MERALDELRDLDAREGAFEVAHRVAAVEDDRVAALCLVEEKLARLELAHRIIKLLLPNTFEHTLAVLLGLQPADAPEASVREGLVIEVDRVLCGENDAEPDGAGLLHQRQQRRFGWRGFRVWRHVACNFVKKDERAQIIRARLRARPGEQAAEEKPNEKVALVLIEVGDVEDAHWRLAWRCREQRVHVEWDTLGPRLEAWRGDDTV